MFHALAEFGTSGWPLAALCFGSCICCVCMRNSVKSRRAQLAWGILAAALLAFAMIAIS